MSCVMRSTLSDLFTELARDLSHVTVFKLEKELGPVAQGMFRALLDV